MAYLKLTHTKSIRFLAVFSISVITIGIVAAGAILRLTQTFDHAVEQAKTNLDTVTTARVSTMAMEQALYHLLAAKTANETRSAAVTAIKGASFLDESLQQLYIILPDNDKVNLLNQLNAKVKPIRMEVIIEGMHNNRLSALDKLHRISPMTLQIDNLSQEILNDGQKQLIHIAKQNIRHGIETIWILGAIITLVLITAILTVISNLKLQSSQQNYISQLSNANNELKKAHNQLLQSEKMASIGQLAAGVAHEINNPIGYVFSNFTTLQNYIDDLLKLVQSYVSTEASITDNAIREQHIAHRKRIDLDYIQNDVITLMQESMEGIDRVRKIVQDLKDFSHVDSSGEWQWTDLQRGLESTLNIVNNEIRYHADVVREFSPIPEVQCYPSQINQVFMNLLVNAAHAMESCQRGTITIRTKALEEHVVIDIEDTGSGISPEIRNRIFDPFFTTKPVGKGTGMGLSLSYGIIQKHQGKIDVFSEVGVGTRFQITLPIQQPEPKTTEL